MRFACGVDQPVLGFNRTEHGFLHFRDKTDRASMARQDSFCSRRTNRGCVFRHCCRVKIPLPGTSRSHPLNSIDTRISRPDLAVSDRVRMSNLFGAARTYLKGAAMTQADHYRDQSERARRLAEAVKDPEASKKLIQMAEEFRLYAERLEEAH